MPDLAKNGAETADQKEPITGPIKLQENIYILSSGQISGDGLMFKYQLHPLKSVPWIKGLAIAKKG